MAYQQITLAQFRAIVINRLGSLGSTFFRADELNRYIQESLRVWNSLTGYWKTRALLTTSANTVWYSLPGAISSRMRMAFNDNPMSPSSLIDLDMGRRYWESETTTTGGDVPSSPQIWGLGGINLIAIWPADALGNNTLLIDGIASTPILANDSSFVDIGQEELDHLTDYIEHIALFKEGGLEFKSTESLFQGFLKGASIKNSLLMASSKYKTAMGMDNSLEKRPRKAAERLGAR